MSNFISAARRLAAALLPQDCFICGGRSDNAPLCRDCDAELPRLPEATCPVCALPLPNGVPAAACGACLAHPPHFDATIAVFAYAYPVDHLVQALKYRARLPLAGLGADALAARGACAADCIVPMPLHPRRLRERGFNQALEIARPLARRFRLPLLATACTRAVDTAPQASLPWKERHGNVRGVFECGVDLMGKSVVVVDDVMTTGATLDEFARTLKKHGAIRVSNWVVARTLPR